MKKAGAKAHFPQALPKSSSDFLDLGSDYPGQTDRGVDLEPQRDVELRAEDLLEEMVRSRSRLMAEGRESWAGLQDPQVVQAIKAVEGLSRQQQVRVYEALGEMLGKKGESGSQSFQSPKQKAVLHRHVSSTQKRPHSVTKPKPSTHPRLFPAQSHELVLRILSAWGAQDLVGITELELFTLKNLKIQLSLNMIQVRNAGGGGLTNPSRMLNGVHHTVDEKNMWIASLPKSDATIEVVVLFPQEEQLREIRIWNYNGGLLDLGRGVKDCAILLDGSPIWQGILKKGCGNRVDDYSTLIPVFHKPPSPQPESAAQFHLLEEPPKRPIGKSISLADHLTYKPVAPSQNPPPFTRKQSDSRQKRLFLDSPVIIPGKEGVWKGEIGLEQPLIPELIQGSTLTILIHTTWGDLNYVGLCGVEMWDNRGFLVEFEDYKRSISANPPDINILQSAGNDPRTVDKLLDGVNWTCDDFHVWLAPFTAGTPNEITIKFDKKTTISMIRIWNYNKSRIHSYRGAKKVSIRIDSQTIFSGDVSKAPGSMRRAEQYCEYLLFTSDSGLMQTIEKSDWVPGFALIHHEDLASEPVIPSNRPGTAAKDPVLNEDGRPVTRALVKEDFRVERPGIVGKKVKLELLQTWGDAYYVGLTGVEVLDEQGFPYVLKAEYLFASPKDLNSIQGYSGDYRTVDKLINGNNVTTQDRNMWLTVFRSPPSKETILVITFPAPVKITGIRLWNYNKSREDTARGVKTIRVLVDDRVVVHPAGVPVRRAPGTATQDFGQVIPVPQKERVFEEKEGGRKWAHETVYQGYVAPLLPTGFTLKILLLSTWGDLHYIGLTGVEVFGELNQALIPAYRPRVRAEPASVSILEGMQNDPRTADKLIDGFNETADETHTWLAPFQSNVLSLGQTGTLPQINEITLVFDKVVSVGCIVLWNYFKTPVRGVKDFAVYLDEALLYIGMARESSSGPAPTSVLFTGEGNMVKEHGLYTYAELGKPRVKLYNEKALLSEAHDTTFDVQGDRPTTSVNQA